MSLINNETQHVKFISYTGKYPNLCSGILTLEIDGKTYRFGHNYLEYKSWETDGNHDAFWSSGGGCGFLNNYAESYVNKGAWIIDVAVLPEELRPFAAEIDKVFNENVAQGYCGGCL